MQNDQSRFRQNIRKHKLWLYGEASGQRASFQDADLKGIDFSDADLRSANFSNANLSNANFRGANLSDAIFKSADLTNANLKGADIRGADIDFSYLPLWCGSLSAHFDDKQLIQIAYHLVRAGLKSKNASDETKKELSKLIDFANKFHRVNECGKILKEDEK